MTETSWKLSDVSGKEILMGLGLGDNKGNPVYYACGVGKNFTIETHNQP